MSKMNVVWGDFPQGVTFYNNPGSIRDCPIREVFPLTPEEVKQAKLPGGGLILGRKLYFVAVLEDDKRIVVVTDLRTFERLLHDLADGPVPADVIAAKKREKTRTLAVFSGVLILGTAVLSFYLEGYLSFLAAFCLALFATLASNKLFPGG